MLDTDAHSRGLHALDVFRGKLAREIGILGHIFEVPSAKRTALNVYRGSQQYAQIFCRGFLTERYTLFKRHSPVEGRGYPYRSGEACRDDAFVKPYMIAAVRLFTQAVRSVGNHYFFYAEPFDAFEPPEILAGAETRFFFERKL